MGGKLFGCKGEITCVMPMVCPSVIYEVWEYLLRGKETSSIGVKMTFL